MQSCRRKGDSDKVNDDQEIFMWSDVLEVILRGEQQNFAKLMDVYLQHEWWESTVPMVGSELHPKMTLLVSRAGDLQDALKRLPRQIMTLYNF